MRLKEAPQTPRLMFRHVATKARQRDMRPEPFTRKIDLCPLRRPPHLIAQAREDWVGADSCKQNARAAPTEQIQPPDIKRQWGHSDL